jgi:hypothetical protein
MIITLIVMFLPTIILWILLFHGFKGETVTPGDIITMVMFTIIPVWNMFALLGFLSFLLSDYLKSSKWWNKNINL